MKHLSAFILCIGLFTFTSKAQFVTIPDPVLRDYMMQWSPACFNASNMLDTTCSGIVNETNLILNFAGQSPSNWDGFQYFKNLQVLNIQSQVGSLPSFPATLKKLILPWYSNIPALPSLPGGLTYLSCPYNNALQSLPALPNSLKYLDCSNNLRLTALPTLPNSLDTLNCDHDSLLVLPLLPASLKWLDCGYNLLTSLPALPAQLKYFNCNFNYGIANLPALPSQLEYCDITNNLIPAIPTLPAVLKTLNVGNNPINSLPSLPSSLQDLNCGGDQLTTVPTLPPGLINFNCSANYLTTLPALPGGITGLDCGGNQLTVLPSLPPALTGLYCQGNLLTQIPVLSNSIWWFSCSHNLLTSLPTLPDSLGLLFCDNNLLTSLPPLPPHLIRLECYKNNLYFLPDLPETVNYLACQQNHINCLPVLPTYTDMGIHIVMDDIINCIPNEPVNPGNLQPTYDLEVIDSNLYSHPYASIFPPYYPLCSIVNNVHHCAAFPLITGHVFNDNNNNSIKDANEPYRSNIKVQLSNGAFTFSNSDGYFQIPADSIGTYTATVTPPRYYTSVPLQHTYNFNSYDTLVTGDFALQATASVDSLYINIAPVNRARPGFPFPYVITYSNGGTTTLSPAIVFNYDNTRLIYDSSSNASVIHSGNSLTLSVPGFVAGQQDNFKAYFRVNPAAVIGDSIRAYANISGNTANASDSVVVPVRGSYDPNDKEATPALSPAQVMNGNNIYYTIRFQNTGTDTAFSVVIADTLDALLEPASLQVINTSHPCKVTIRGNIAYFEFINILLPDSNVNQLKSHGYVSFRIKPQSTVTVNNSIPNKAAIYFDYNSPVITNIAVTTITDPVIVPLKLLSFIVNKGTGLTANVYWQTSNEINVSRYDIEMSTDGRNYRSIAFEKARGDQSDSYTRTVSITDNPILYFRLKMSDLDRHYTYSQIAILKNDHANTAFSFLNNPVKDVLSISLDETLKNTTATILTAQGEVVKRIMLQHDIENIDVKSLSNGTYYLLTEKGSSQFVVLK